MILRKPYAILIKNFKIIHLFLAVLMVYILYKTYNILTFFNNYLSTIATTISNEVTNSLFGYLPLVLGACIIVISIIILALMKFKDKPIKTYLYTIFIYISYFIYYITTYSTVKSLELNLVDIRQLKIFRDLTTVFLIILTVGFIIVLIRSTGFDIKSFNFKKDLEDLNIETEDSEEFEVNTEIDTSKLKRTFNKKVRHFKYAYLENKLLINILISIVLVLIIGLVYYNVNVVNKKYKLNDYIKTDRFIFNFTDSYLTKYDYKFDKISNDTELLIIRFKVKTLFGYNNIGLGSFMLDIDGYKYHHKMDLRDETFDIGKTFIDDKISNEFSEYILVFEIPVLKEHDKMILKYFDNLNAYTININPVSLNEQEEIKSAKIDDELQFTSSVLRDTSIKIKSADINNNFKFEYQDCTNKCNTYYEYIVPSTKSDATSLLKIDGELKIDLGNEKIDTLYEFIKTFGKIKYLNNGVYKYMNIGINQVKPRRAISKDIYLEITEDVKEAEHIILEFNIRGKLYTYNIK